MIVTLPTQECAGSTVQPAPGECGAGTLNPDCEPVCDGEIITRNAERFGVIGEDGSSFRLYLGAGVVTNGINCALFAISLADAELISEGSPDAGWRAVEMDSGLVTLGLAGGCLWVADTDMDPALEAAVIGAGIEITTGFTGTRAD
jgi:hypothetical protein